MSLHPPTPPPPKIARRYYLHANRLYAQHPHLLIRTADLPPQTHLNARELQLQEYLGARRATRGDGSPIHGNPQQVYTFSATDQESINTVLDDVTGFVEPLDGGEDGDGEEEEVVGGRSWREVVRRRVGGLLGCVSFDGDGDAAAVERRVVDGSHRRLVQGLLGQGSAGGDAAAVWRIERGLAAQGF